jgi:hypothetical protein
MTHIFLFALVLALNEIVVVLVLESVLSIEHENEQRLAIERTNRLGL